MKMSKLNPSQAGLGTAALALALACLPAVAMAVPDIWDDGFGLVGSDGPIHTAIVAEDSITVGGAIAVMGGATVGNVARWDGSAWKKMGSPFNGAVRSLVDKDGTIYAGGDFTKASFTNLARVAKWNGSAWSAVGSGIQGPAQGTRVNAVTFFQDKLFAAGNFTKAGGMNAIDIAYWDGAAWHGVGDTDSGAELHEMIVYDNRLCVVGAFTRIANLQTEGVACWNGTVWEALGTGLNGAGLAMATHNGFLYVGGSFSFAGGKAARRIARWNGSAWEALAFPLQQSVVSIGFRGNTVVVGVSNGSITDPEQPWLIEWNGVEWSPAAIQPDGLVHALVPSDFGLLAVGSFPRAGQLVLGGIGFWSGLAWTTFVEPGQRGLHGVAQAFATYQGQLYVAGSFKAGGEVPATLVARWNMDRWEVVGNTAAAMNDSVDALVVMDDGLYVGGRFAEIGGVEAANVARWNGVAWSAVGGGINNRVSALRSLDGKLYAGGSFANFTNVDDEEPTPAAHIAAWDGEAWSALGAGVDGYVFALSETGGDLIVGGAFLNAGGGVAHGVARWDGGAWHAVGSGLEGSVYALHADGDVLHAGGALTATGVTPLSGIAQWNGSAWLALGSGVTEEAGVGTVRTLTSFGENLFVGGSFDFAGGVEASQIAYYDGESWYAIDPGFRRPSTSAGERVNALHLHDQALWVGGSFVALLDGRPAARVTAWLGCAVGNEIACAPSTTTTTTSTTTTTTTIPVETICGDANDDGNVVAGDALIALRAAVGSDECELPLCDTDDNGSVTAADALAILRFAVGLPSELGCPSS